jgi:hypothetical protein
MEMYVHVIVLSICVLLSGCSSASDDRVYEGHLELATRDSVVGWVWDPSEPDSPVTIEIMEGDTVIAKVPADQYRQDLLDAGKGNGKHGFVVPTPKVLRDGAQHDVSVRVWRSSFSLGTKPISTVRPGK